MFQSIYAWRGANIENIINFEFNSPVVRKKNYRSNIFYLGRAYNKNNKNRLGKRFSSFNKNT
ncbi:MAG: hypothetical protein CM15mP72_0060 [Pelagibacteraceae bacterium]|nr:MAG: hypothetical protein CM15mP72_0060 [Pelagibacteraceae bacterium]